MAATFGASPVGPKEREGDERTPEGTYHVSFKVKTDAAVGRAPQARDARDIRRRVVIVSGAWEVEWHVT
jgi:hypothetical protein